MENHNNFIEEIIIEDKASGKNGGRVQTRFPPEPNGFLHLGHSKSICLNFGIAERFEGKTNLRFDDTNPVTEDTIYVESIKEDIAWLGFNWDKELYASDYFDQLYEYAVSLIKAGKAYVDDSTSEEIAQMKGTPTVPGVDSPYKSRSPEENLSLFEEMKAGKWPEGSKVLRADVDMKSPNMLLRDPIIYRIKFAHHHRTGDKWCIYPLYDFAHGYSDSIEHITHSICTLEFENHRPLYDWFLETLDVFRSRQIEFARLNLNYTVMSKRKLLQLVNEGMVSGWDDPRMPTISGARRRGYTAAAIRNFAKHIGIAKRENVIELSLLEFFVREDLNKKATRVMAVLDPIKVVITNYPDQEEWLDAENNPEDLEAGTRPIPFSSTLYIEREDFMEDAPKKYFRLTLGQKVRLKHAYIVQCDNVVKNDAGDIVELHCTYFPESKSGQDTSGIEVKSTIHWVSAKHAIDAQCRLYDRLFTVEDPDGNKDVDFKTYINPESLTILESIKIEPSLQNAQVGQGYQFLRKGYFCLDKDSTGDSLIFNRTVTLKDTWAKLKSQ